MTFTNETALITGASQGLGRALALELARPGSKLVLVARQAGPLEEAAEAARSKGAQVHAIAADVGDPQAAVALAGQAAALVGGLDLLIHNASTLGPTPLPLLLDTDPQALRRVLEVNLEGPFRLTRAVVGGMVLRRRGQVMFVSSDAAVEAYPGWGAYGVSKAALDHLSRIWAAELEGTGVRILAVDPGEMDTAMHAAALPEADPSALARPVDVAAAIAERLADPSHPSGARLQAQASLAGGGQ